jgi:hypothetical protein
MTKKILILAFLLTSSVVILPSGSEAATVTNPQIRIQLGSSRYNNRWRNRRWRREHRIATYRTYDPYDRYNTYDRGDMVRQVYYIDGRRYVRWVRRY